MRHRVYHAPTRRDAGLTLIEIMAAAALLAVFLTAVFGMVVTTARLRNNIEEMAVPYQVGPVVLQRVADDLSYALIEPYKEAATFKGGQESVGGETVSFVDMVTAVPSRAAVRVDDAWVRSAITEVGYRLRRSETADGLLALYRREDFAVDEDALEGGKFYKLADRVKEFRIDYFEEDPGTPDSDAAEGLEEWETTKTGRLPWGCRITLVLSQSEDQVTDESGQPREYHFVTYVAFPSRFDEAGGAPAPGPGGTGGGPR